MGVGTPGTAETGTGPPEDDGIDDETAGWALRRIAALESEVAALTDALKATTHEFDPTPSRACEACFRPRDHPVHRTPARVRAELEER